MNWHKARMEGKERSRGVEYAGRRRSSRPWITESSVEEEDRFAEAEFVPPAPVPRAQLDEWIASLCEG